MGPEYYVGSLSFVDRYTPFTLGLSRLLVYESYLLLTTAAAGLSSLGVSKNLVLSQNARLACRFIHACISTTRRLPRVLSQNREVSQNAHLACRFNETFILTVSQTRISSTRSFLRAERAEQGSASAGINWSQAVRCCCITR